MQQRNASAPTQTSDVEPATRQQIKALILKSADIVETIGQKLQLELDGRYLARSDFGSFLEETALALEANSQEIRQTYRDLQVLTGAVDAVQSAVLETGAYIRTGLLYYRQDGAPVYGAEIGQQDTENGVVQFRKYCRLTAQRLSFYDSSDTEVAWISDRLLHITAAEVGQLSARSASVDSLRIGSYSLSPGRDGHLTLA